MAADESGNESPTWEAEVPEEEPPEDMTEEQLAKYNEEKQKQAEADTEEVKTMAKRKGYKLMVVGENLRRTEEMCARFSWQGEGDLESTAFAPVVFKNASTLGVIVPDMGDKLPWEEVSEHLVTVEISLDGQQYTESGLQFLYKAVDPSLTDEALKALDAEDAKGKKAPGKKK